jgi:hypothetical protein
MNTLLARAPTGHGIAASVSAAASLSTSAVVTAAANIYTIPRTAVFVLASVAAADGPITTVVTTARLKYDSGCPTD